MIKTPKNATVEVVDIETSSTLKFENVKYFVPSCNDSSFAVITSDFTLHLTINYAELVSPSSFSNRNASHVIPIGKFINYNFDNVAFLSLTYSLFFLVTTEGKVFFNGTMVNYSNHAYTAHNTCAELQEFSLLNGLKVRAIVGGGQAYYALPLDTKDFNVYVHPDCYKVSFYSWKNSLFLVHATRKRSCSTRDLH